jgi:hypothetical protein
VPLNPHVQIFVLFSDLSLESALFLVACAKEQCRSRFYKNLYASLRMSMIAITQVIVEFSRTYKETNIAPVSPLIFFSLSVFAFSYTSR